MTNRPINENLIADNEVSSRFSIDTWVGLCVLGVSAVIYAITLTFEEAPDALAQNVQPATFPKLVVSVMALLSVVVIIQSLGKQSRSRNPIHRMSYISALVMIAFAFAFQYLGLLVAMVLLSFSLPVIWGERNWPAIVGFSILFPLAVHGLFAVILKVHFEPGIFGIYVLHNFYF